MLASDITGEGHSPTGTPTPAPQFLMLVASPGVTCASNWPVRDPGFQQPLLGFDWFAGATHRTHRNMSPPRLMVDYKRINSGTGGWKRCREQVWGKGVEFLCWRAHHPPPSLPMFANLESHQVSVFKSFIEPNLQGPPSPSQRWVGEAESSKF